MPKIRPGMRRPPPGFDLINDKLDEYDELMRVALSDDPSQAQLPQRRGKSKKLSSGTAEKDLSDTEEAEKHLEGTSLSKEDEKPVPPLWRVARINRERTRYVFDSCYHEKIINTDVLNYCAEMNFIDAGLLRRWRLPGYERLCCTACCVPGTAGVAARMVSKFANRDKNERSNGTSREEREGTCICRVPAEKRRARQFQGCTVCGCMGCGSGDKRGRDEKTLAAKVARVEDSR